MTGRPTNFLSLPHELRQDILMRTWSNEVPDLLVYSTIPVRKYREVSQRTRKLEDWVGVLRDVDVQIAGDVDFVERQWRGDPRQQLLVIKTDVWARDTRGTCVQIIDAEDNCRRARITPYGRSWSLE